MSCLEAPLHQPPAPFSKAGVPLSKCPPRTLGRVEKSRRLAVYTWPGCLLRAGGSGLGPQEGGWGLLWFHRMACFRSATDLTPGSGWRP